MTFRSDPALTVLDQQLGDPAHGVQVKMQDNRLALKAATATSKQEGRLAREVDIRNAYHLTTPGEARGPDGDHLAFWRGAVRLRAGGMSEIADLVGADFAGEVGVWLEARLERVQNNGPLSGCVVNLHVVFGADDLVERVACLLSDFALARTHY